MSPVNKWQLDWRILILLMAVDAVLRGLALWKSAQKGQKWWFIALFIINSAGILPAIYFFTQRIKTQSPGFPSSVPPTPAPQTKLLAHKKRPVNRN